MKFYSTLGKSPLTSLENAILKGIAPDGSLYLPQKLPTLKKDFFKKNKNASFSEIAYKISKLFLKPDLPKKIIKEICFKTFNFSLPLIKIDKNIYSLELFHGKTLAFKDFGARFMANLVSYFAKKSHKKITILVATSGDTGSAVAQGFLNIAQTEVVILYPKGKVSKSQEKQLTATNGNNILTFEVNGNFDDCQNLVKKAFCDKELNKKLNLTSANSINIARLLPQTFYHFYLSLIFNNLVISVPSGNYGNLTAGIIAKKMGAPIIHFIVSTNRNDALPRFLKTGKFEPKPTISTISNAMDVGNPNNFPRILNLYKGNLAKMKKDLFGFSFTDEKTKKAISNVFQTKNYLLDPHGAIAYLGLTKFLKKQPKNKYTGVFLATAHPAKFSETVEKIIKKPIPLPFELKKFLLRKKQATLISADFSNFKEKLLAI